MEREESRVEYIPPKKYILDILVIICINMYLLCCLIGLCRSVIRKHLEIRDTEKASVDTAGATKEYNNVDVLNVLGNEKEE